MESQRQAKYLARGPKLNSKIIYCLLWFEYFLTMLPFPPFGTVMYNLCRCMLEVCDQLFCFDLTEDYS